MSYLKSYKRINRLIQNESFEPMISWGVRMALSGTLPVIWGLATGKLTDAIWITLTAEAISWVEMKGSFAWRVRTLLTGASFTMLFAILGTITGFNVWLSTLMMLIVGFLATLLKGLGDRASGLAICVYLLFIICNAYPATEYALIEHRIALVAIGAAWPVLVGVFISLLMPAEEPFRRQIALIWRSIAALVETISRNGAGKSAAGVYVKENDVRDAMDNSYQFYSRMAHQADKESRQYPLILLRKTAGLVAVNVIAIGEEMERIPIPGLEETVRIKGAAILSALKEAVSRISIFVITLKPEEKLLAISHINRLKKLTALVREYPQPGDKETAAAIKRILQLIDRTVRLLENSILRLEQMGKDAPVFRSYSLSAKTLFLLRPRYLLRNAQVLFNFNALTTRYALRSAIAAATALFIYKWYRIDHGYWLPFSVMIVIQPYFGATFKKATDRIAGTLLGGLAGSLLLHLPAGLHIKEAILFLTFILMVYYIRRKYAVAAFVITLNLVLLFNIESAYNNALMVTRALCTIGGAFLAVLSGFALLPTWDKKWLPSHLAAAIRANYDYFISTFFSTDSRAGWTKNKRMAESKNSDVFDSFNRYLQEPGKEKSELYYELITYCVRLSRNLNIIHLEQDEKKAGETLPATTAQQARINECLDSFNAVMNYSTGLSPGNNQKPAWDGLRSPFLLNDVQATHLEKLIIELKAMQKDLEKLIKSDTHI